MARKTVVPKPLDVDKEVYVITLNGRQVRLICTALELLQRLDMGHVRVLIDRMSGRLNKASHMMNTAMEYLLKAAYYPELTCANSHHGVGQKEAGVDMPIAYDIQQVLRYRLAWDRVSHEKNPSQYTVDFRTPLRYSEEPQPTITRKYAKELIDGH